MKGTDPYIEQFERDFIADSRTAFIMKPAIRSDESHANNTAYAALFNKILSMVDPNVSEQTLDEKTEREIQNLYNKLHSESCVINDDT